MKILEDFGTKNYTGRPDIVQKSVTSKFVDSYYKKYITW